MQPYIYYIYSLKSCSLTYRENDITLIVIQTELASEGAIM